MSTKFKWSGGRDNRDQPDFASETNDDRTKLICIPHSHSSSEFVWRSKHARLKCRHKCVTFRTHFSYWRSRYDGDLRDFYRMILETVGENVPPYEEFVAFAYRFSSTYI